MISRLFIFVLVHGLAGLAGWQLGGDRGALVGVVLLGMVWVLLDWSREARLVAWLRQGDLTDSPVRSGLLGELADRTRRLARRLNQQSDQSAARLQDFLAAIQASPNGVVLLDPNGGIEWCNQTAAAHLGIDAVRDLGQLVGNLVRHPSFADYDAGQNYLNEVMMEGRYNTAARPVLLSLQLHRYGEGRKLLLTRDVTAVQQAEAMRRDFIANVSHEIRTPLTVLSGVVETLQSLPLNLDERERYLSMMMAQTQRMQSLVNDLLALSRLEGSPAPSDQEWTPLAAIMSHCEQEARALSSALGGESSARQRLLFAPTPPYLIGGSQTEMFSAFSNLISNAVRYTPANGTVEVSWDMAEDGAQPPRLMFSVQDTGMGIAAEHIPRLTERFYRVDQSRSRETGGTGLGLAIVKHVLQRHGAELKISSTPGQGSRFSIVLSASRTRLAAGSEPLMTLPGADLA